MGVAVAGEEALEPHHVGAQFLADQDGASGAQVDQGRAPDDQRAHDLVAQLGLGDEQRAQALRRYQKRLDVGDRLGVDQRRTAGQILELGEKVASLRLDDRCHMAQPVPTCDCDRTREDDEHAGARLASGK